MPGLFFERKYNVFGLQHFLLFTPDPHIHGLFRMFLGTARTAPCVRSAFLISVNLASDAFGLSEGKQRLLIVLGSVRQLMVQR